MHNKRVIAFSGGCYSGKTTTMELLKSELERLGHKVIMLSELIREEPIESIDDIRKDPEAYIDFQCKVIRGKMQAEREAAELSNGFILIDRAITDSFFYLLFYVDKANLSSEALRKYSDLLTEVRQHFAWAAANFYDLIVEFKPIEKECNDTVYRPKNIDTLKYIEHTVISTLNIVAELGYDVPVYSCDLNETPTDDVLCYISRIVDFS